MYQNLKSIIDFFVSPFLELITDIGISDKSIRLGFGSIEWFDFTLYELTQFILSFLVVYLFIMAIVKILKIFIRIISGGVL